MLRLIDRIQKITNSDESSIPLWYFPAEKSQLSLKHIINLSRNYADKLQVLGIHEQERVGLVMNNCSDFVALLLAIWRINAVAVPLRPRGAKFTQVDKLLQYCDQVCDFRAIIYDQSMTQEAFGTWMTGQDKITIGLDQFIQIKNQDINRLDSGKSLSDIAILQFSSGSTGQPKGVIVTHAMMMAQLENIVENHAIIKKGSGPESIASWMPAHHDLGLFIGILTPIYLNCRNILAPPSYYMRNPPRWFTLLATHQVDFTFTTNSALATTMHAIKRLHRLDDIDLSKLHLYIAAEKVSPITVRQCWETLGPLHLPPEQIHIGYGMAENTLGCACTKTPKISIRSFVINEHKQLQPVASLVEGAFELVALGQADNNHEITVRDEAGKILPELTLGEFYIKSPCVSPGYFNNPELSAKIFSNGCFRSGDLGFYFQNELYFYARKDDMIIIGGRNIIPNDIEECIEQLDFIRATTSCMVTQDKASTGALELVLLIEANAHLDQKTRTEQTINIQKLVMNHFDLLIPHVIFCSKGSIEKTSSGKKRRKVIRDRLLNRKLEIIGDDDA